MNYSKKINLPGGIREMDLLDTPIWNKGTAFADSERTALGLHGLLPPRVESLRSKWDVLMKPSIQNRRTLDVISIYGSYRTRMKGSFTG